MTGVPLPLRESLTVEFKSDPKGGLSDRVVVETVVGMTNAEGGTLYIGVNDDGSVSGLRSERWQDPERTIAFIASNTIPPVAVSAECETVKDGKKILIVQIPKAIGIVATNDGKVLKRRLKIDKTPETLPLFPQEFVSRLSEIGRCDYSAMILPNSSVEDLDVKERTRLRDFIRIYHGEKMLFELEDEEFDKALGLVRSVGDTCMPTVAGLLMMGKEESIRKLLPGATSAFQHLSGTDVMTNEDFVMPLLKSFDALLERFKARNTETELDDGLVRVAVPTYSERAFREALVNAFSHRDYTRLHRISVRFHDDGLEITSPGGFVSGVTLENLLTVEPHPRNPLLADIFKRLGLAERTGRGIDRIFEGNLVYGRPVPDYSESNSEYVRVFFPKCDADPAFYKLILDYQKKWNKRISVQSLMILSAIRFAKRLTLDGLLEATHLPAQRLKRHVETLVEDGLLDGIGRGPGREWILNARFYKAKRREAAHVRLSRRDIDENEEMVLKLAQEKGTVTRSDVMELLGIQGQAAYRILSKLTDMGCLVREGDRRWTTYRPAK